jgi:hypothetical protein
LEGVTVKKPGILDRVKIAINKPFDGIVDAIDFFVEPDEFKDTGAQGEQFTYNLLCQIFSKNRIFRNAYLTKKDGKTTEIDLIVLDNKGIYVIESKNYSGWIFGNSADRYWTATLPNRQKNRFYNPVWQNANHIEALDEKLGELYPQMEYFSLIVFSERCELKKITCDEPDTCIFQRSEIRYWIKQLKKEHPDLLSEQDVEKIADWLRSYERPSEAVRQQHIEQLQEAARTCPWCGSALVERANKKTGEIFMGCTAFPKCRYTAKPQKDGV